MSTDTSNPGAPAHRSYVQSRRSAAARTRPLPDTLGPLARAASTPSPQTKERYVAYAGAARDTKNLVLVRPVLGRLVGQFVEHKVSLVLHQELGGTFQIHKKAVDALDVLDFHTSSFSLGSY